MNRTTPTAAIVAYCRLRYARAPSWTAAEIERIRSLPGDRARRDRAVSAPYKIAHAAPTSATSTPWCVRKLDKKVLRGSSQFEWARAKRSQTREGPPPNRAEARYQTADESIVCGDGTSLLARNPEPAAALGGPR